jgi:CubicO group peptidase (beta-lactamase class C family)
MKANKSELISNFTLLATVSIWLLSASPSPGEVSNDLTSSIEKAFELGVTPGMALAVVEGDKVIYAEGFGYADLETKRRVTAETMFYIASTTKSLTAFAAALLDHQGKLDLDQPINRYLPELRLQAPLSADSITLRDLLTHTHGIDNSGPVVLRTAFTGDFTDRQLIELMASHPPSPEGRVFTYGNVGYNLAGLVMNATQESDWKEIIEQEILRPLQMTRTSAYMTRVDRLGLALPYHIQEQGFRPLYMCKSDENMHAAGGHVSTVLDLAQWLLVHINRGELGGKRVFPAAAVSETHRLQAHQDKEWGNIHRYGWGLGWDLGVYDGDTLIHRFGSFAGYRSHLSFMPKHIIGVVILVNESTAGSRLTDLLAEFIYDHLLKKPDADLKFEKALGEFRSLAHKARERVRQDKATRSARPQILPLALSSYTGVYDNHDYGSMEWNLKDNRLEARMGLLWSPAEVYDGEKNQLRVELAGGGEVITFTVSDQKVVGLSYDGAVFEKRKN